MLPGVCGSPGEYVMGVLILTSGCLLDNSFSVGAGAPGGFPL
jgi:hypothetical protein